MLLSDKSQSDDERKPVYARSGWLIPTEKPPVLEVWDIRNKSEHLILKYRSAKIRSVSAYPYNCVGMIFAARRAYIEIGYIHQIFKEDGYRQISKQEARVGDLVVYRDFRNELSHVALITNIEQYGSTMNIKVLSKWGWLAEVEHYVEDVPNEIVGKPAEYWTESIS